MYCASAPNAFHSNWRHNHYLQNKYPRLQTIAFLFGVGAGHSPLKSSRMSCHLSRSSFWRLRSLRPWSLVTASLCARNLKHHTNLHRQTNRHRGGRLKLPSFVLENPKLDRFAIAADCFVEWVGAYTGALRHEVSKQLA